MIVITSELSFPKNTLDWILSIQLQKVGEQDKIWEVGKYQIRLNKV